MTACGSAYGWVRPALALLLVALGCCLPLITLNAGFYEDDELYMAMVSLHPDGMSPVAPLTFLLGRWWQALFGEGLAQLHWLAYAFRVAASIVACLWLWRHSKRLILAALLFVVAVNAYPRGCFTTGMWRATYGWWGCWLG